MLIVVHRIYDVFISFSMHHIELNWQNFPCHNANCPCSRGQVVMIRESAFMVSIGPYKKSFSLRIHEQNSNDFSGTKNDIELKKSNVINIL